MQNCRMLCLAVALFTRAWIEIINIKFTFIKNLVALFTRAWIEIPLGKRSSAE